jgi:hypothetical protein
MWTLTIDPNLIDLPSGPATVTKSGLGVVLSQRAQTQYNREQMQMLRYLYYRDQRE